MWAGGRAGGWMSERAGGMWESWVWLWARGLVGDGLGLVGLLDCWAAGRLPPPLSPPVEEPPPPFCKTSRNAATGIQEAASSEEAATTISRLTTR